MDNLPKFADEMFCYSLYTTWHVINRTYRQHLSKLDLTYPQYITLTLLWENDQQTVGEISAALLMETSTLTPLLKRMENNGLVTRTRSKEDERLVFVCLTQKGRDIQAQAPEITACMVRDTGLSMPELETITALALKLRGGLVKST